MQHPSHAPATSSHPIDRRELIAVAVITALGALCRLVALRQPMRYDEAVAWVGFIGQDWWTILSEYPTPNNHVFFSLLAKATSSLAPYQPWAIRLPALLPGIAIVPATWAVGRRLADRSTALLGAALAAGSMPLVLYSTNARGHSLVVLGGLALVLLGDRLRTRPAWLPGWVAYVVVAALGLWTAPLMIYSIAAVSLWLALHSVWPALPGRSDASVATSAPAAVKLSLGARLTAARSLLMRIVAADVMALALAWLLYLPIIRAAGLGAILANKLVRPVPWPLFGKLLPPFLFELVVTWSAPLPPILAVVLVALAAMGMPRARRGGASFAFAAVAACLGLFLFSHAHPFVRVWLFFVPLFLLAVGRGLVRLQARWRSRTWLDPAWTAVALAVLVSGVALRTRAAEGTDDTGRFAAAREVTQVLAPQLQPGDRVLATIPLNGPLLWYFCERGLDTAALNTPLATTRRAFLVLDPSRGQTLARAVEAGVIEPTLFREPTLLVRTTGAEVWRSERR
ncbi:MAG TPA: glycosyltransferase family 39 protein [Gemmatimonadaceae bacterium]|nr:glycosyltransferase family 39 protein [Gemmatimonadaceae bacterium]